MAQPEMVSIANVAKASVNAYNEKNWDKVRASLTPDCVYEEVATNRKVRGVDETLTLWQGWARAIPDSRATFESQFVSENMVALELWRAVSSWNAVGAGDFSLHFIRNKEQQEVDFLIADGREPFLLVE